MVNTGSRRHPKSAPDQIISPCVTYVYRVDCPNRKTPVDSVYFQNSTVRIHAVAAGPRDGPALLLLHGFPEFWYGWRKQIEPLATAGVCGHSASPSRGQPSRNTPASGSCTLSLAGLLT